MRDMMSYRLAYRRTLEFLHQISQHLSGRKDCQQVEYILAIGCDCDQIPRQLTWDDVSGTYTDRVFFYPERRVCPNVHFRLAAQKQNICDHVILHHFNSDVFKCVDEFGAIRIQEGSLLPGIYKYTLSRNRRKRKWMIMT